MIYNLEIDLRYFQVIILQELGKLSNGNDFTSLNELILPAYNSVLELWDTRSTKHSIDRGMNLWDPEEKLREYSNPELKNIHESLLEFGEILHQAIEKQKIDSLLISKMSKTA